MDPSAACTNATPLPAHVAGRVLRPEELPTRTTFRSAEPAEALRPWVERYWSVVWTMAPGERFTTSTLEDPAVHLTRELGTISRTGGPGAGEWITGPVSAGRFDATLRDSGSVVGVKFTVGGVAAFAALDPAALRDRTVAADAWFPALPDLPPGRHGGGPGPGRVAPGAPPRLPARVR